MKELPTPTLPFLGMLDFHHKVQVATATRTHTPAPTACTEIPYEVVWARHQDEVREAQALRYHVFAEEMGARLSSLKGTPARHDADVFDEFCEHLLVRTLSDDDRPAQVIGTYRVLTPGAARRAGGYYTDTEFDLTRLRPLRERMAELGRSCVHPDFRTGGVILSLWGALAAFMDSNGLDTMVGCASIPMRDGGHAAASIWHKLSSSHMASVEYHVRARTPLPVEELNCLLDVEPPPLIKGYLRCGARVLGAPAWDPDFNTADLPILMRLADLPTRYRRHFLSLAG
jgi:putative hemolysin